jgi:hypothetical protein
MFVCFYIHGRSRSARLFGPPTLFIKDPAEPKLSPNLGASAPHTPVPSKKKSHLLSRRDLLLKRESCGVCGHAKCHQRPGGVDVARKVRTRSAI